VCSQYMVNLWTKSKSLAHTWFNKVIAKIEVHKTHRTNLAAITVGSTEEKPMKIYGEAVWFKSVDGAIYLLKLNIASKVLSLKVYSRFWGKLRANFIPTSALKLRFQSGLHQWEVLRTNVLHTRKKLFMLYLTLYTLYNKICVLSRTGCPKNSHWQGHWITDYLCASLDIYTSTNLFNVALLLWQLCFSTHA